MAVFKNQIPILEFDSEQNAVIMPRHHFDYNFPRKAVMLFMEPEINDFVAQNQCEVVGKFVSVTKKFWVYKTQIAHDIRNWGNDFFAAAMKIAMEAITEI